MTSCIFLAAGFSSRFGSPKALARLKDKTLIERLQEELLKSRLDEIVIVLGAHYERIEPLVLNHKKIKLVYNKDYNLGQSSSFKAGLQALNKETKAILLLPVDFPLIRASTIDHLIEQFNLLHPKILVPTFKGNKGHPPIFSASLKTEFLLLPHEKGINSIIHDHEKDTVLCPVKDAGVLATFNTQEEFEKIIQEI